jgi:hypothetical protein
VFSPDTEAARRHALDHGLIVAAASPTTRTPAVLAVRGPASRPRTAAMVRYGVEPAGPGAGRGWRPCRSGIVAAPGASPDPSRSRLSGSRYGIVAVRLAQPRPGQPRQPGADPVT